MGTESTDSSSIVSTADARGRRRRDHRNEFPGGARMMDLGQPVPESQIRADRSTRTGSLSGQILERGVERPDRVL